MTIKFYVEVKYMSPNPNVNNFFPNFKVDICITDCRWMHATAMKRVKDCGGIKLGRQMSNLDEFGK